MKRKQLKFVVGSAVIIVAIAFLVFDVELLFLYPWAVAMRHAETADPQSTATSAARGLDLAVADGWVANRGLIFAGAMVFILLVVLGFVYDWRKGVFRWR